MSSPPHRSGDRFDANEIVDFGPLVELAARVVDDLPADAPASWRPFTYRALLAAMVQDRVENETGDLEDGDAGSLTEFVQAAAAAAQRAPDEFRDDAYEVVLQGLLGDWVENWNEPEADDDDDDE